MDVRRVRDDQIPPLGRGPEIAFPHLDVEIEPLRVLTCERDGVRGRVNSRHAGVGTLVRDRERDRPRAGAEIEHARLRFVTEQCEAPLDDDLRLGTRYERARIRVQDQPPKTPLAEDVRQRLAPHSAFEQVIELIGRLLRTPFVHARARDAEHVCKQQLGIDPRSVDTCFTEPLLGEP